MPDRQKKKWSKVMTMDVMSSDESEDGNIAVKDLTWRSDAVNSFFPKLDEEATKKDRSSKTTNQS